METSNYIKRLRIVPNLFNLTINKVRNSDLKEIIKTAERDGRLLKVPMDNLMAFANFLLCRVPESKVANDKVLDEHPKNINAICMKIVLSAENQNFTQAETYFKRLEELKDDALLVAEAEAECAFMYSKMGPPYNLRAISKFTEVLKVCPENYKWKYRMAVIIRRCQHPSVRLQLPNKIDPTENFASCNRIFEEIISDCHDETIVALCLVEMAALYIEPNCTDVDFEELGIDAENKKEIIKDYLDMALHNDCENPTVLREAGRILRRIEEYTAARRHLRKSVLLEPNTQAYHHLALTVRRIDGVTPTVIDYLERASESGRDTVATFDLGRTYLQLTPPNCERALECLNNLCTHSYGHLHEKYKCLSMCYHSMASQSGLSCLDKRQLHVQSTQMNRTSILFRILCWMKSTPKDEFVKLNVSELFPVNISYNGFCSYSADQRTMLLNQVHKCQGTPRYEYLDRLKRLLEDGSICDINDAINEDLNNRKYEDCLELILFLLITDINGIDQVVISTFLKILQLAVEAENPVLPGKCLIWPIEYLYMVDNSIGHVRIIVDPEGFKDAEVVKSWLEDFGLVVIKNDEDISPFLNRREALIESLQGQVAILCIIKDNNLRRLEDFPINQLPPEPPYLIPVPVDDGGIPEILRDRRVLRLPERDDKKGKALWIKNLGEIILQV